MRGGTAKLALDATSPFVTTMKPMQFNEDFRALPMEVSPSRYFLYLDLTSF